MSALQDLVGTPLAGAIGWTLLHSLWEGAAISAVLAAVFLVLRSPRLRYAAACFAMLAMLGGFAFTLSHLWPENLNAARAVIPSAAPAWNIGAAAVASHPWTPDFSAVAPWLAPFWFAGVLFFCARYAAGFLSLRRLRRKGVCHASARWQQELSRLSARLRLSRPVLLLESSLADAPAVLGCFRPLVLIPAGLLTGLPPQQMEAILLHELAHIRRHDYLVNLLQRLAECLLFYHPAAWWISRIIGTERENCCDDLAVSLSGDAHQYASALAALEQNRWSGREPALAATGGSLVKRIRRLLYPKAPNGPWAPLGAAMILVATAAVALGAWQASASATSATGYYAKWLNQDVTYIITAQERVAFQKLATDEERNQFIQQFWERRNPPGVPEGAFKKEHYRRRAYANEHFASSEPGWKTDRGHMYIVYGPPDEIEAHPKRAQNSYGVQIWLYHHIAGLGDNRSFTFIDRTGQGDYQLAPGTTQ